MDNDKIIELNAVFMVRCADLRFWKDVYWCGCKDGLCARFGICSVLVLIHLLTLLDNAVLEAIGSTQFAYVGLLWKVVDLTFCTTCTGVEGQACSAVGLSFGLLVRSRPFRLGRIAFVTLSEAD